MTIAEETARPLWSRSQISALRECSRKLVLTVRAAGLSADGSPPLLARAASLKRLKSRHLWTGSVVHDTIGTLLKSVRQGEDPADEETLVAAMRDRMREDFRRSRDEAGAVDRLFEHAYNRPVSTEAWKRHWATAEGSLRWFIKSKWLQRLKAIGPECWKAVEEVLHFDVNGIKAFVKIDCAIEKDGRFVIMDWTTSVPDGRSEPALQTAALYAHEVWGAEPEQIEALAISLLDGSTFHARVDEETLMETHLRIEEESAAAQEILDGAGTDPLAVAPPAHPAVCLRCSFQAICHPDGLDGAALPA